MKTYVDPITECRMPFVPQGRFVHVPPTGPRADWNNNFGTPWWQDVSQYQVGRLSSKTRWLLIVNTLTGEEHRLEVTAGQLVILRYVEVVAAVDQPVVERC